VIVENEAELLRVVTAPPGLPAKRIGEASPHFKPCLQNIGDCFLMDHATGGLCGGTGLRPVVSSVALETVASRPMVSHSSNPPRPAFADEIRRDAGFDGRDARATLSKTCHKISGGSGAHGTRPSEKIDWAAPPG